MFGKFFRAILPALALSAVPMAPALAGSASDAPIASEWRNPGDSVHVRIDQCGAALCGTITWASDKAIADARRGGTEQLVGTHLFRDLKPAGPGKWSGKVFVPDIRQTFSGTIHFQDGDKMVGKGCVLFGVVCKAQTWSRVR
ncbi:DUF2147 domain-containing protein [Nostoc ellipsosporum NOK]|uniref:DUF2147 domain-containing protein n=1 Tax=Sphingomonas sp. IBVSS2 TaxID=1985172 RepID=UPI000A2DAAAF|nr:DUF2147 domain-containing protein [Sphingomonas sp. IBVSS2]MDF2384440.1 DUF2147 domain-containing protein [Nostoc ellipsosporum NOK]OSZ69783.1 hypothetical protein CAP40_02750 [Sphingomonas sp. IBVSS2]